MLARQLEQRLTMCRVEAHLGDDRERLTDGSGQRHRKAPRGWCVRSRESSKADQDRLRKRCSLKAVKMPAPTTAVAPTRVQKSGRSPKPSQPMTTAQTRRV